MNVSFLIECLSHPSFRKKELLTIWHFLTAIFSLQEERELLQDIFGSMEPMPPEEFYKLYTQTGIDIDGRISEMLKTMPFVRRSMQCLIGFVKTLPGFNQLSEIDKIALLKGNIISTSCLQYLILLLVFLVF